MTQAFDVAVERDGHDAVLRLSGELDLSTVGLLECTLVTLLRDKRRPVRSLVVDMSDLQFADLAGLRPLLTARADLTKHGGVLSFSAPPYPVRRILALIQPAAATTREGR